MPGKPLQMIGAQSQPSPPPLIVTKINFVDFPLEAFFSLARKKSFISRFSLFFQSCQATKLFSFFCSEILSLLKAPQKSQKIEKLIFISDTKGEKQTKKQKKRLSFVSSRCSQPSIFRLARFPTLFGRRRRRRSRSRAAFTRRRASERTNDQDRLEGGFSHRFRGKQHHPQRQRRRRCRQRQRQRQHQQQKQCLTDDNNDLHGWSALHQHQGFHFE